MAKNKRSPTQGQELWEFGKVCDYEISANLLLDQMYRHYTRHIERSDEEADHFRRALKYKIKSKEKELKDLTENKGSKQASTTEAQSQSHPDSDGEEVGVSSLIDTIHSNLKKHTTTATEEAAKLRSELQEYITTLDRDIEYHQILTKLNSEEELSSKKNDSSISDHDTVVTPRPSANKSYRRSQRVRSVAKGRTHFQTSIQQENEIEELSEECEELKQQLENSEEDRKKLSHTINQLNEQIEELKTEKEQSHKKLEQSKKAQEEVQLNFEELNSELAQLRNSVNSSITTNTESSTYDSYPHEVETSDTSLTQDNSEESEEGESSPQLLPTERKDIIKSLKDLNKQVLNDKNQQKQYIQGYKLLKKDFINHGRKNWNNKTVESYINLLCNKKKELEIPHHKEDSLVPGMELTMSSNNLKQGITDIQGIIQNFHTQAKAEIKNIQNSKGRFLPIQAIHKSFEELIHTKLEATENLAKNLFEEMKDWSKLNPKNITDQISENIKQTIARNIEETLKRVNKVINQPKEQEEANSQYSNEKLPTRKLVIIPKDADQASQINLHIREEIKKPEIRSTIKAIRKTLNNNIEIRVSENYVETLKKALQTEELQEKADIIQPDQRKMKILLLRVPNDLSKEDLQTEFQERNYFRESPFEIIKHFPVRNGNYNNWVVQSTAKTCRQLIKKKRINIITDSIRIVHHVRVQRCSNCQALDHHTSINCQWASDCANCALDHKTEDCTNTMEACINCIRDKIDSPPHKASSPECPSYQKCKTSNLNKYYEHTQGQRQPHINSGANKNDLPQNHRPQSEENTQRIHNSEYYPPLNPRRNDRREREQDRNQREDYRGFRREHNRGRVTESRYVQYRVVENSSRRNANNIYNNREARPPHCR